MATAKSQVIRVAGLWELGWNTPIKEVELWEYPMRDFEVERFYMVPVSGIVSSVVEERETLEAVISECTGWTPVFVDERDETPLGGFTHPGRALYIFGRASQSALPLRKPGDQSVRIETALNAGMLWPHQAVAIILYDRIRKTWL